MLVDLSCHTWSLMNSFQIGQGPCRANLHKWCVAQSPSCDCGQRQTMNHIFDTCLSTRIEGGLNLLYKVDDDAVIWLESTATAALRNNGHNCRSVISWGASVSPQTWSGPISPAPGPHSFSVPHFLSPLTSLEIQLGVQASGLGLSVGRQRIFIYFVLDMLVGDNLRSVRPIIFSP